MSKSKTMPSLDIKVYIKLVAAVFCISSITAFIFVLLRLITPPLFFLEPLHGNSIVINYFMAALMLISSGIGFINSAIMMKIDTSQNTNQDITKWLLMDSIFETTRIIYIFVGEVVLKVNGPLQIYELLISTAQYCKYEYFETVSLALGLGIMSFARYNRVRTYIWNYSKRIYYKWSDVCCDPFPMSYI